jgi:hypothetical protein
VGFAQEYKFTVLSWNLGDRVIRAGGRRRDGNPSPNRRPRAAKFEHALFYRTSKAGSYLTERSSAKTSGARKARLAPV